MPLIIFVIFVFIWYFPVYRKQGKINRLPRRTVPIAILLGMIPVFIAIILLQIIAGKLLMALPLSGLGAIAFDSFINAALVEEFVKFLAGYLIIRRVKPQRKVDHILIFGAVGLGYEVTESLLILDSVIAGVFRGVFALHIIWQFWMGCFYYEYRKAKENNNAAKAQKNLISAFAVPILMHGMNDFLAFAAESKLKSIDMNLLESVNTVQSLSPEAAQFLYLFAALLVFAIIEIVFQIVTFRKALKAAKESALFDPEALECTEE